MVNEIDTYLKNRLTNSLPADSDEGWRDMSEPVSEAMQTAGPKGFMEFSEDGTKWRMHYADGRIVP